MTDAKIPICPGRPFKYCRPPYPDLKMDKPVAWSADQGLLQYHTLTTFESFSGTVQDRIYVNCGLNWMTNEGKFSWVKWEKLL